MGVEGLDSKTVANLASDRQRNNDLTTLRSMGGPFTTPADVDTYLASGGSEADQNKKLYLEVVSGILSSIVISNTIYPGPSCKVNQPELPQKQ